MLFVWVMKTRNLLMPIIVSLLLQAGFFQAHAQLFTKITTGHVVTTPSGSRSCNFLDFDHDDFQDLLITNGKAGGENNMLYRNAHDGTFTLMADTICNDGRPSDGATCADYDNDGFIDTYITNWYGIDNLLYHNDGGASYTQIDTGIVPNDGGHSETAAWGDMDGDGLLDLYVANSDGNFRNFLYHNLGAGAFEKVTGIVPVTDQFASRCVNWIDMDLDGDQDLFVANESGQRNQLYRNDGYPNFTKITTGAIVTSQFTSHSSSWADYDNDGDFDLLVANYNQVAQLFQNDGTGTFTAVSSPFGGDLGCAFSSSFADYDNDADLDLVITNGFCQSYVHNFLYDNNGNGTFVRNMSEPVAIDSGSSYGCAWGDYDNDGFMDLAVANWRNETQPNSLYHNNGNGNHWMQIKLEGTISNRSAIGTIVRCLATINGNPVSQMREVTAQSGYCSQNSLVVHFGLADATRIDNLEVTWPSGMAQVFGNLDVDQLYGLVEGGGIGVVGLAMPQTPKIGVRVFPNPSDGTFTVAMQSVQGMELQLEVLDMLGRSVFVQTLHAVTDEVSLPISLNVPDALYQIRVSTEALTLRLPLVIAH